MERYKAKVRFNAILAALACAVLAVFSALTYDSSVGLVPWVGQHGWRSFVSGAACGMAIAFAIDAVRGFLALRDEKKLKKRYIKENDERNDQIRNSALSAASTTVIRLEIVALFIASYIDMTVGITILACAFTHAILILTFKLYYSKKY